MKAMRSLCTRVRIPCCLFTAPWYPGQFKRSDSQTTRLEKAIGLAAEHFPRKLCAAKKQMDTILKVGTREASIFRHAGEIELKLGNVTQAEGYFRAATKLTSSGSRSAKLTM